MNINYIILVSILIFSPNFLAHADSSRTIIHAEEDVFVDKSKFFNPNSLSLITGFGGTRTEFVLDEDTQKPRVISNDVLPITTYLKFDLNKIPSSTLFETVNIEDSKIKLFFTSPDDSDATTYVFTVSYCKDNQWSEEITWETRPCKDNLEAVDTTIINEEDIPGFIELDIIGAINKVKEQGESKITLTLDAQPILFDVEYDQSEIGTVTDFVQNNWSNIRLSDFSSEKELSPTFYGSVDREFRGIWKDYLSNELLNMKYIDVNFVNGELQAMNYSVTNSHILRLASLESEQIGHAISPTIIVDYNIGPSVFNDSVIFTLTIILPTLTIVVPVFVWMYKKSRK